MQDSEDCSLNIGLVLLAAGFGTRFGGDKQLSIIGPEDAIIMDYTIYDAWRIGYSWVTVILRDEIVDEFERQVGCRWRDKIQLHYSIQHTDAHIPSDFWGYSYVAQRRKPWGTAHALLCAAEQVRGPFAVANADDFYGYHGLKEIFFYLHQTILSSQNQEAQKDQELVLPQAMVGFQLGRTLSENGTVSRGICHTYFDEQGCEWLDKIEEHTKLIRGEDQRIRSIREEREDDLILGPETPVSMNLFGLQPRFFAHLQRQFETFLHSLERTIRRQGLESALKKEFYLPSAIEVMLEQQQTTVTMLHSPDPWFGLTYLEDVPTVRQNIAQLIQAGQYPADLFAQEIFAKN